MESPDWTQLQELVAEYGHGEVTFWLADSGEDGDDLELTVDRVALEEVGDEGNRICVVLSPRS